MVKRVAHAADAVRALKDSPDAAAWAYFGRFFFGPEHPYGRPHWGDEISLRRITRQAVRDYYRRIYVGSNIIVTAAGDFDHDRLRALLVDAFGRLPAGLGYRWLADRPAASPNEARLLLVDKPDATQTYFLIGFPGIRRNSPDLTAVWLVNTILGGTFTSMLNEALRVNGGLTYGAYSLMDQNRLTGAIAISTSTPTATTGRAVDKALAVLDRLRAQGITAGQLQFVKNYLKGVYPAENLQTPEQLAALLADSGTARPRPQGDRLPVRAHRRRYARGSQRRRSEVFRAGGPAVRDGRRRRTDSRRGGEVRGRDGGGADWGARLRRGGGCGRRGRGIEPAATPRLRYNWFSRLHL